MNANQRKTAKKTLLLTTLLVSLSANSAKYEMNTELGQKNNGLNIFSNPNILAHDRESAAQQIKENYQTVLKLIKQGEREQAKQKITELISQDPQQSAYYNLQALLEILDNNQEQAKKNFHKALELDRKNLQALVGLAKLALDGKQYDPAKKYASQALKINSNILSAYRILADVAMQQQGIDAAEKVLLNARKYIKDNRKAELGVIESLGKLYVTQKHPEKILPLVDDLLKRYPYDLDVLTVLAEAQIANQQISQAEQTLTRIIAKQPNDVKHRFMLARLLSGQPDRQSKVLALLDEAASNLDNPGFILAYKTAFLIKQKKFDQAMAIAQKLDKEFPKISIGKILIADVFLAQKKYQQALQNYQYAYQIMPTAKILDAILRVLNIQSKPQEAITLLENELKKYPQNDDIRFRLANAYQNARMYEQSIQQYQALLPRKPDNVVLLNNLAWAYGQQDNPKALELAEKAYKKAPESGVIADTYGYILLKQGKKQQALDILKHAAELAPKLTEIQLHLAEAYHANQNQQQARQILQHLINTHSKQEKAAVKLLAEW